MDCNIPQLYCEINNFDKFYFLKYVKLKFNLISSLFFIFLYIYDKIIY